MTSTALRPTTPATACAKTSRSIASLARDKMTAMAVTLTLEQLADHLRIERAAVASGDPRRTILVELMQACMERVEQYAPDAPRDTQNLAVARFAGYVYDAPSASAGATYGPAFLNSGAVSLLNPWRRGWGRCRASGSHVDASDHGNRPRRNRP